MESSQSCAPMLTHCSTEPLTTGPDYDLLLRLVALAGDVHPNPVPPGYPARPASKMSLAKVPATCVQDAGIEHSRCSGIRNVADYCRANGWICTACRMPSQPRAPSPPPHHAHHVRQDVQHTTVEHQWHQQQTDGTKHLPRGAQRQSGSH